MNSSMVRSTLYPEIEPFSVATLRAGEHTIYFEQSGNVDGLPVVFLHGGPGSGCNVNHRRYFNPDYYRIIIFDQRGCHRSTPQGYVQDNTTQHLLNDINALRNELAIEKWLLFGGSWGATLALLYAEQYPDHVSGMILRGTFLARWQDLVWFVDPTAGVSRIFPDYWQTCLSAFERPTITDLISALHARVFSDDLDVALPVARAWALWAGQVVTHNLNLDAPYTLDDSDPIRLLNEVRIEAHYAKNRYFIAENKILEQLAQVPKVPLTLLHGRKDLTCPLESSWRVHQALPHSKLVIVADAGHLASEPAMVDALVTASDEMASHFEGSAQ